MIIMRAKGNNDNDDNDRDISNYNSLQLFWQKVDGILGMPEKKTLKVRQRNEGREYGIGEKRARKADKRRGKVEGRENGEEKWRGMGIGRRGRRREGREKQGDSGNRKGMR